MWIHFEHFSLARLVKMGLTTHLFGLVAVVAVVVVVVVVVVVKMTRH